MLLLFISFITFFAVNAQNLKIGDSIPLFKLSSSQKSVDTSKLKGKVILINLFATWCGPCQLELAEVEKKLWPKYSSNKNFELIVIGREHTNDELAAYNKRKKSHSHYIPIPVGLSIRCLQKLQYQELISLIVLES